MRRSIWQVTQVQFALILASGLLAGCGQDDAPDDQTAMPPPEIARIVSAEEVLAGAQISTLDPHTMNDAEIRLAVGTGALCLFRYTSSGKPVLALRMLPDGAPGEGAVKLNGNLVKLQAASAGGEGGQAGQLQLAADPIRVSVAPERGGQESDVVQQREADMVFEVGQDLTVGYRGYFTCTPDTGQPQS